MRITRRILALSAGLAAPALLASMAHADVMARGQANGLEATVMFATDGDRLLVTLTNSALSDVLVPANVLTAVFFDIAGLGLTLAPESAVIDDGAIVRWGSTEPGGGVGGEWAFRSGLSGAPGGALYGIGAAGFGLFGPHDSFPGANLDGQSGPQGLNYGLLSAGDNPLTGNTPVTGSNPLIQSAVVFALDGLPEGFSLGSIGNVTVQYGTSLSEPSFPATIISVPAPSAAAGVGMAMGLLAIRRRRA